MSLEIKVKILCQSIECNGTNREYVLIHTDFEKGVARYQCPACNQMATRKLAPIQMEMYNLRKHEATIR